ncbi:NETI motif-containing protein [Shouchella shacheensis]|uniref:NETI motif-containing protein n=1 Tax=Shouchella shacheensis TaxID=1649580 RepID=UPI00073FB4AE|nr:NETI motif-containing protein [Shouchella shacheensis]
MAAKAKKQKFEVQENETIGDCLARMEAEGYAPVRRMEEPVFAEQKGKKEPVWLRQRIVFEGVPKLEEE